MKRIIMILAVVATFGLTACESLNGVSTKQGVGAASGAIIGGILGSNVGDGSGQLWATGAGALLGGLLGSEIGASLDKADRAYVAQTNNAALEAPVGEQISWNNPDTGNYGYVTPTRDGTNADGSYCREYQQTIYVGGKQETGVGTACQQADGSWKIVS